MELYLNRMVRGRLRTSFEIELRLKRTLNSLKDRNADEIHRRELRTILDKTAGRGVLREAEKQRQAIRVLFHWALGQDIIEVDPTAGIASYGSSQRRDRVLAAEEIKSLWHWFASSGMPTDYSDALRLQLSTGARIGEIAGLQASEINPHTWLWTLPATRSKNGRPRVTPLVGIAKEIVESRLNTIKEGPLFLQVRGEPLNANCVASLIANRRKGMPIEHFTSHDLRRTVATCLVDLGFSYEVVAAVLGHEAGSKEVRTLVRHYIRTDLVERKRQALQAWDVRLHQIYSEEISLTNVVPIAAIAAA